MVVQAVVTTQKLEEESYRTLQQNKQWSQQNKQWSSLPTAGHVVQNAESILFQQSERYTNYAVDRVGHTSFEVRVMSDNDVDADRLPIPFVSFTGADGSFGRHKEDD